MNALESYQQRVSEWGKAQPCPIEIKLKCLLSDGFPELTCSVSNAGNLIIESYDTFITSLTLEKIIKLRDFLIEITAEE